ncbi:MAG TPA: prepilin-type N-terminal cleavage/methylation domain-containing protein [Gemmatimonadaceae bacterium]|nr:prepilin-type N-terminal cleavage/methylation domain-containing protein [Gemmatimonadaceae bacterium]
MPARRRGFTVIELVMVMVILAILGAIAYGRFNRPALTALVIPDSVVAPQASGRFVVQVRNAFGRPQEGVQVVFRVVEGGATISPGVVETDSEGSAAAQWIAASTAGLNAFAASVGTSDWNRSAMTVTMRVDPAVSPIRAPADAPQPAVDTARPALPRDTSRGGSPADADEVPGRGLDTMLFKAPSLPVFVYVRGTEVLVAEE